MKLHEAIRLGGMSNGQAYNFLAVRTLNNEIRTCALGGAGLAIGVTAIPTHDFMTGDYLSDDDAEGVFNWELEKEFPHLADEVSNTCTERHPITKSDAEHPIEPRRGQVNLRSLIIHLNDFHHMSRQDIADRVQAWEEKRELELEVQEKVKKAKEAVAR